MKSRKGRMTKINATYNIGKLEEAENEVASSNKID